MQNGFILIALVTSRLQDLVLQLINFNLIITCF